MLSFWCVCCGLEIDEIQLLVVSQSRLVADLGFMRLNTFILVIRLEPGEDRTPVLALVDHLVA